MPGSPPPGVPAFEDLTVGDRMPELLHTPTKVQLVMYAGAEDDYMPVHFDHQYAVATGQPGVIAHGWLTYATLLRAVARWIPPEVASVVATSCRYVRPVFPEQPMRCTGTIIRLSSDGGVRRVELQLQAVDAVGEVTTTAKATLEFG